MSLELSIVVPHYGDPTDTLALLEQLAQQVEAPPFEVIAVDDASPVEFSLPGGGLDTSVVPPSYSTTVVRRDVNGGFGSAVNSGVKSATGELLLILNSDLTLSTTFLRDLVAAGRPLMPAVVGPKLISPDWSYQFNARRFPTLGHQVIEWLTPLARVRNTNFWHRAVGHDPVAQEGMTAKTDWLVGAALLMPRELFVQLGGFDERFHMNSEEVDLQKRAHQRGVPSYLIGDVTVTHEGGASSDPLRRRGWLVTSRKVYADKWFRGGRLPLQLALTAATAVNVIVNSVRRLRNDEVSVLGTLRSELELIWKDVR